MTDIKIHIDICDYIWQILDCCQTRFSYVTSHNIALTDDRIPRFYDNRKNNFLSGENIPLTPSWNITDKQAQ